MAALNDYQLAISRQAARGTPAGSAQYVFDVTASDVGPSIDSSVREETGQGSWEGDPVVTRIAASGGFTALARPTLLALQYFGALGANATTLRGTAWAASTPYTAGTLIRPTDTATHPYAFEVTTAGTSGTTEPTWANAKGPGESVTADGVTYTNRGGVHSHEATAAAAQPYLTLWTRMFSGAPGLVVRIQDVKLTGLNLTGEPGGDLSAQSGVVGGRWAEVASVPGTPAYVSDLPLRVPGAVYEKDGVATAAISQFGVNLASAVNTQQTNEIYDSYFEEGRRSCEVTFTEVYENKDTWRKVHLGRASLGDGSPSGATYYEPLTLTFENEAGAQGLALEVPRFGYQTAPLSPNTNAEMALQQVTGRACRPKDANGLYTGASPLVSAVNNTIASYPNAA